MTSPLAFLRGHPAEARHAVRVMAAVGAAYAVYAAFDLPQGYWAVFTTLIVMQASIGGTVGASVDRMYGTVLGALVGGAAAGLRPLIPSGMTAEGLGVAVVLSGGITAYVAMLRTNMKVAPVTAAIMLLSSTGKLGPLHAAAYRVVEIALGSVIGVAATLVIFPARSRTVVAERTARVIGLLMELLGHYAQWLRTAQAEPTEALHPLHDAIRAAIGQVELAVDDAERERAARLGDHRLSPATPRTLWRIRSEAVTLGRALRIDWPAELRDRLSDPGARDLDGCIERLDACRAALRAGTTVRRDDGGAHAGFQAAMASLRREHVDEGLTLETVGATFSFAFALETLSGYLADLADRIDEAATGRRRHGWAFRAGGRRAPAP